MPKAYPNELDYIEPQVIGEGEPVRIESWGISLPVLVTALVLYLSSAFQLGYFLGIGTEFLSLLSSTDWLFSIGLTIVPLAIFLPVLRLIRQYVRRELASNTLTQRKFYIASNFINSLPAIAAFIIAVVMALLGVGSWYSLVQFILVSSAVFISISQWTEIVDLYKSGYAFGWVSLIAPIGTLGFTFLGLGLFYSQHIAGLQCTLIATDGKFEQGDYLRSAGDGHLLRIQGQVVYIPKDKVFEIVCGNRTFNPPR